MAKRIFDVVVSLFGLFVLSVVFLVIAWRIKTEDGGPVLYPGIRVGLNGVPFRMYKFRTMIVDADKLGGFSTADDDPRITGIGKKLRKMKLDEIPQLINVFKGDMSLVGPRPEVQHYVNMFDQEQKGILTVRPGITDWASLWNSNEGKILAGNPDPENIYMEKVRPVKLRLQQKYVKERSFFVDLKIIVQTLAAIFSKN